MRERLRRLRRETSLELKIACAALLLAAIALLTAALLAFWLEDRGDDIREQIKERGAVSALVAQQYEQADQQDHRNRRQHHDE